MLNQYDGEFKSILTNNPGKIFKNFDFASACTHTESWIKFVSATVNIRLTLVYEYMKSEQRQNNIIIIISLNSEWWKEGDE